MYLKNGFFLTVRSLAVGLAGFGFLGIAGAQELRPQHVTSDATRVTLKEMVDRSRPMIPEEIDLTDGQNIAMLLELIEGVGATSALVAEVQAALLAVEQGADRRSDKGAGRVLSIAEIGSGGDHDFLFGPVTSVVDISHYDGSVTVAGLVSMAVPPRICLGIIGLSPDKELANLDLDYAIRQNGCPDMHLVTEGSGAAYEAAMENGTETAAMAMSVVIYPDGTVSAFGDALSTTVASGVAVTSAQPPQKGGSPIKICVYRGAADGDCDYDFFNPAQTLAIELQGRAVLTGDYTFYDQTYQASVSALLRRKDALNGGGCYLFDLATDTTSGLTMTYSSDNGGERVNVADWLVKGIKMTIPQDCLANQDTLDYFFKLTVRTGGTPTAGLEDIYIASPNVLPSPPNLELPNFVVNWGCMAAGSLVQLADGRKIEIEEIRAGNQVVTGDGTLATVTAVSEGREPHPLIVVEAENGALLRMTRTHPVPTLAGLRMAQDLVVGDWIQGLDRPHRIAAIRSGETGAEVFNLVLEGANGQIPPHGMTFISDGLVVGDYTMQGYLVQQKRQEPPVRPQPELARFEP